MGVFSPVWFLEDAGVVHTNKEKVKDESDSTEIRSVGGWYLYLLKGYVEISVFITFYEFFGGLTITIGANNELVIMTIMFFVFWPIILLLITLMMGLGILALDITFDKRN